MTAVQLTNAVRRLRGIAARQDTVGLTEADLCERFVQARDETAFETLVRRHGPMVLAVCRRILRHEQDAEDAFQATFLVLVRRAGSLQSPSTIGNWLHGVAYRTALEARSKAARRRAKEAAALPRTVTPEEPCADLWPALHEELAQVPQKYRIAIVLCDLEGRTRAEAAQRLGLPPGTVASRLARGRAILAKRLARRGFAAGLLAAALSESAVRGGLPAGLVASTVAPAAERVLTANVIALSDGVVKSMFLTKIRTALAALFLVGIVVLSAGGLLSRTLATEPGGGGTMSTIASSS